MILKNYKVVKLKICTFDIINNIVFRPNLEKYPESKTCVIDLKKKIAIDIMDDVKYDYIETINGRDFIEMSSKKIKPEKRVAVFPEYSTIYLDQNEKYKVGEIIKKLESGYEFLDGNQVYNNEEYLRHINHKDTKSNKKKIIRLVRKGKNN